MARERDNRNEAQLVVHILFRLDYGGLENGIVNVVNSLTDGTFRHAVIALTEASEFRKRLRDDVGVYALNKKEGKDVRVYLRLYRLLRRLKPHIVHTRNLGTLECAVVAFLAGVPLRIHGEHGWDVADPDGTRLKYRLMRRVISVFIHRIVAVSEDLRRWLLDDIGISRRKVRQIYNGVDISRFRPEKAALIPDAPGWLQGSGRVVVGSVTRFSRIKDPLNLVQAYIEIDKRRPANAAPVYLVMVGDGEMRKDAVDMLAAAGLADRAWLPGSRDDIANVLRAMDVFVLGSFREGVSNTILEAMATGLPIVATRTGGNGELILDGVTGTLVQPADPDAIVGALMPYVDNGALRSDHGDAARARAVDRFSMSTMIENYRILYSTAGAAQATPSCVA